MKILKLFKRKNKNNQENKYKQEDINTEIEQEENVHAVEESETKEQEENIPAVEESETEEQEENVPSVEESETEETVPAVEELETEETVPAVEELETEETVPAVEELETEEQEENVPAVEELETEEQEVNAETTELIDELYTTNIGYIDEETNLNISQGWVKYDLHENDKFKKEYFDVNRDEYIEAYQTHAVPVETIPFLNAILKDIYDSLSVEYKKYSKSYRLTNQYYHDLVTSAPFVMYRFEPYTKGGKIKKNCYIVSFDCTCKSKEDLWRGTLFFNRQEELQMANIEIIDQNKVSHKIKVECKYNRSTSRVDTYKYTSSGKRLKKAEFNPSNANHLYIKKGQKLPQWNDYTEEQMQQFKELLTSKTVSETEKEQVRQKIIQNVREDVIEYNIIYK